MRANRQTASRSNERGIALVTTLIILVMLLLFGGVIISAAGVGLTGSTKFRAGTAARYAAESGAEMGFDQIWNGYLNSTTDGKTAGGQGKIAQLKSYLANLGLADGGSVTLSALNNKTVGEAQTVSSVSVTRKDIDSSRSRLIFTANGRLGAEKQQVQEVFDFLSAGSKFSGFGFALLANNTSCIWCHAKVDNLNGTQRIKVGSLESLMIRTGSCDSLIAGTLYTRGKFIDKTGANVTSYSTSGMDSQKFNANGDVQVQSNGQPQLSYLQPAPTTADGYPYRMANFYKDYPDDPAYQSDGPLPSTFPPAIEDTNGNRIVDASEFQGKMNQSTGTLSGGKKLGVPSGSTFSGNSLDNITSNLTTVNGSYNGNLVLYGTDANPIVINGDLAVNGDLVLKGKVKGTGRIYVRGNTYAIGDVEYADGTASGVRTFGKAQDGTQNLLAIASGGNMVVGDFITDADGTTVDTGTSGQQNMNFVSSVMSIFNRAEWSKTQQYLPDSAGKLIANSTYVPGYVPRYYTLYAGAPVGIYMGDPVVNGSGNITSYGKSSVYWNPTAKSWVGSEHTKNYTDLAIFAQNNPLVSGAVFLSLAPASNWITIAQLRAMWAEDAVDRPLGDIVNIDGLLYTNNGTFELSRKKSDAVGRVQVNGAMVSADIGVLAGGGSNVLSNSPVPGVYIRYDSRLANFLGLADTGADGITVMRMTWNN